MIAPQHKSGKEIGCGAIGVPVPEDFRTKKCKIKVSALGQIIEAGSRLVPGDRGTQEIVKQTVVKEIIVD